MDRSVAWVGWGIGNLGLVRSGPGQVLSREPLPPYPMFESQAPDRGPLLQPLALTVTILALPQPLGWSLRVLGLGFQVRLQR